MAVATRRKGREDDVILAAPTESAPVGDAVVQLVRGGHAEPLAIRHDAARPQPVTRCAGVEYLADSLAVAVGLIVSVRAEDERTFDRRAREGRRAELDRHGARREIDHAGTGQRAARAIDRLDRGVDRLLDADTLVDLAVHVVVEAIVGFAAELFPDVAAGVAITV